MAQEMGKPAAGATDVLVETNQALGQVAQMVAGNADVPDEIKELFANAAAAYQSGLEALTDMVGGGGTEPMGGAVAPEVAGSRGAVPVSPAGVR